MKRWGKFRDKEREKRIQALYDQLVQLSLDVTWEDVSELYDRLHKDEDEENNEH